MEFHQYHITFRIAVFKNNNSFHFTLPWCQAEPGVIISEILFAQSPKKEA